MIQQQLDPVALRGGCSPGLPVALDLELGEATAGQVCLCDSVAELRLSLGVAVEDPQALGGLDHLARRDGRAHLPVEGHSGPAGADPSVVLRSAMALVAVVAADEVRDPRALRQTLRLLGARQQLRARAERSGQQHPEGRVLQHFHRALALAHLDSRPAAHVPGADLVVVVVDELAVHPPPVPPRRRPLAALEQTPRVDRDRARPRLAKLRERVSAGGRELRKQLQVVRHLGEPARSDPACERLARDLLVCAEARVVACARGHAVDRAPLVELVEVDR